MRSIQIRTFNSFPEFIVKTFALFRGSTFLMAYLKTKPLFREKIHLTVAITNNCYAWTNFHSSLGKRCGIKKEEIEHLVDMNPSNFEHKEWCALKYIRDRALLGDKEPEGEYLKDYINLYTDRERSYILKIMRTMLYSNYINNLIFKRPWR